MKPKYSRAAPSARYRRLIEQYQFMHENGETRLGIPPEQTISGQSLPKQAPHIKRLIQQTAAESILDYGSGKGHQYSLRRIVDAESGIDHPDIKSYWGVKEIRCFDPGYPPFSELPSGVFDGVICTDVLEHCTVKPAKWWEEEIGRAARAKPSLPYEFRLAYIKANQVKETIISKSA